MDADLKERWITALTDGTYEQGRGCLRIRDQFCCLGVLDDVTDPEGWELGVDGVQRHRGSLCYLPFDVLDDIGLSRFMMARLAELNDEGKDFAYIAEVIREEL